MDNQSKGLGTTRGFTLVESLVAAIIGLVLAGGIYVVFLMYTEQVNESMAFSRMQAQYDNLAERVAFDARLAARIMLFTEGSPRVPFIPLSPQSQVKNIRMYNSIGALVAGYSIAADTVKELKNGAEVPVNAGGGPVLIDPAFSEFRLSPSRDKVEMRLRLKYATRSSMYSLPNRKDGFACRN